MRGTISSLPMRLYGVVLRYAQGKLDLTLSTIIPTVHEVLNKSYQLYGKQLFVQNIKCRSR
jgi:hypothetical protein